MTDDVRMDENFARLVVHLGQMAALYFGDLPDPSGQAFEPDIPAAGQTIEMLGMLQQKMRGNLTPAEDRVLEDLLYDLRLRFVEAQGSQKRIIEP